MNKIIQVKQTDSGEAYIDLDDLSDIIDIRMIDSYTMTEEGESLVFEFFDTDGNRVLPTNK